MMPFDFCWCIGMSMGMGMRIKIHNDRCSIEFYHFSARVMR